MDDLTPEQRHKNMSRIRSKNTTPEVIVRKYLFSKGLRYRINDKRYSGKPDIVLPKYKTVIFVNGCFWHKHDCGKFILPKTNQEYWEKKITNNVDRDKRSYQELTNDGWKVITIWECEIKGKDSTQRLDLLLKEITS